jgi:exocyst complex protein 7
VNIIVVPSILQGSRMPSELHHLIVLNLIFFVGGWWVRVKLFFDAEHKLCGQIWYHLDSHREKCFANVTDSSLHILLSFGEAIARSKKSPKKLFVWLDMYETMHELITEVLTCHLPI